MIQVNRWRIRRRRQPYHSIAGALEWLCGVIGHWNACALLNRHGWPLSVPYQWVSGREVEWEPIQELRNS